MIGQLAVTNEFSWSVCRAGHRVVDCPSNEAQSEIEGERLAQANKLWVRPMESPKLLRQKLLRYYPLRNPAIFRMFADVGPDHQSILNFANRFGLLTDAVSGESLAFWQEQISDMRSLVDLWEKATSLCSDLEKASRVVKSMEGHEMMAGDTVAHALHFTLDVAVDHFDCLILRVNQRISNVTAALCRNFTDGAEDSVQLQLRPNNLLQAMWLQFGQAIAANKSFRKCQCGTWFEISRKVARSDKIFCTEACKARAYRQRLAGRTEGATAGENRET